MNSSGMTLRSSSSSPARSANSRDKLAIQRQNRAGIGVENKELHKPANGSPLKRSDGAMNLDIGRASPAAKGRSVSGPVRITNPVFGNSSFSSTKSPSPKRYATRKSMGSSNLYGEKPNFAKTRPQARNQPEFLPPADAAKLRRTGSVENFSKDSKDSKDSPFGNNADPLPSASSHPFNGNGAQQSRPLPQSSDEEPPASQESMGLCTPQNYKLAKPFPAAFHSTGFVTKRGRLDTVGKEHGPQPDTPCKKPTAPFFSQSAAQPKGTTGKGRGLMSMSDFASSSSTPAGYIKGRKSLARKNSTMSNDDGDDLGEYELPPTPTKKTHNNISEFFTNKRLRTDTSCEYSSYSRPQDDSELPHKDTNKPITADGLHGRYVTTSTSPHTPKDNIVPPDPSSLSISGRANNASKTISPATPSPMKDFFAASSSSNAGFGSSPLTHSVQSIDGKTIQVSDDFVQRFSEVKHIGSGEFSEVYQVVEREGDGHRRHPFIDSLDPPLTPQLATPSRSSAFGSSPLRATGPVPKMYAVKKSKSAVLSTHGRARRMEEVDILRELGENDHVIKFVESWEENGHLYIQTEYCENGGLDKFLSQHGHKGRLDEFRVWKVLVELCLGLQHIHNSGFMHLDLKPANVLISFNGTLKISDFGMAARWPAIRGLEREGDRGYIAPEVINSAKYDKPVDIFALGLTIIEVAGNENLPPNGPDWQRLRDGDITVAPKLSTSRSGEFVHRDERGNPVSTEILEIMETDRTNDFPPTTQYLRSKKVPGQQPKVSRRLRGRVLLHQPRDGDLVYPPQFMADSGLEKIVGWMINADPSKRPSVSDLLEMNELRWVHGRRRFPATIFEGLWGPDDSVLVMEDEDMGVSNSTEVERCREDWRMEEEEIL
ncbi:kinase-like protein [Morchella conica CCBAS932]|uniref:Kinase-like protein n=1 Tax=Morchella conica CCBAS932 TaxID=1392247 RepID=A0A3N4L167_9PEZI|nr:kinase-like protein [Morchella conica CCBAS932]